jgi:hypothetical protein
MKINQLKDRPGLLLIAGAMIVGAPRWMDAFGFEAHATVDIPSWAAIHAWSGLGMMLVEALSVWFTTSMLSRYGKRNLAGYGLFMLIVAMFISIPAILIPSIAATSNDMTLTEMWGRDGVVAWSIPMALAPLFIIAASAIAEHLATATGPRKAQPERKADDAVRNVAIGQTATPLPAMQQLPQPSGKVLTLADVIRDNPQGTLTEWAQALGISRQAVAQRVKRLESAGEIRRNGHIVLAEHPASQE